MSRPVVILGNGGHAQVLREIVMRAGIWPVVHGVECLAHDSGLEAFDPDNAYDTALGMGRRSVRREVVQRHPGRTWATLIHPNAFVSFWATIDDGAQIMAGAIIQANAIIGKHAIINTGAQVDHGCRIGDFAHICPGAVLCADVTVEEGAMVEPGSVVRRGTVVVRQAGIAPDTEILQRVYGH